MCFSAIASFTAGAILAGIGTVTLTRVQRPREVPYALIPAIFAFQQLTEGGVWLTIADAQSHLNAPLTHAYQFFSHVLWPIYVPLAVYLLEVVPWRRTILLVFAALGTAAGLYLLYFLFKDPTTSRVSGGHIEYISPHFYVVPVFAFYVLATCASSLFSSHRRVQLFGLAAAVSLLSAAVFYWVWFISVWCFFAAIISIVVLLYFHPRRSLESSCAQNLAP